MESKKKEEYLKNLKLISSIFPNTEPYLLEKMLENVMCTNLVNKSEEILNWYNERLNHDNSEEKIASLKNLEGWNFNQNGFISHESNAFFKIIGLQIRNQNSREILNSEWDQPILQEKDNVGGLLGLLRTKINDLPHYLIEAKYEPGNYNKILLSPTLQATFSNINRAHGGRSPNYYDFFSDYEESSSYLFNNWLTEDGGRLYKKRNLALVKEVEFKDLEIKEGFILISMYQVKYFLRKHSIVNPHLARLIFL